MFQILWALLVAIFTLDSIFTHSVNIYSTANNRKKVNTLWLAEVNVSSWACSWLEGAQLQGAGWVWRLRSGCSVPPPAPTHLGGAAVSSALRSPRWAERRTSVICGRTPTWRGSAAAEGIRPDTASNGCKIFLGARCRWHQRYTGGASGNPPHCQASHMSACSRCIGAHQCTAAPWLCRSNTSSSACMRSRGRRCRTASHSARSISVHWPTASPRSSWTARGSRIPRWRRGASPRTRGRSGSRTVRADRRHTPSSGHSTSHPPLRGSSLCTGPPAPGQPSAPSL